MSALKIAFSELLFEDIPKISHYPIELLKVGGYAGIVITVASYWNDQEKQHEEKLEKARATLGIASDRMLAMELLSKETKGRIYLHGAEMSNYRGYLGNFREFIAECTDFQAARLETGGKAVTIQYSDVRNTHIAFDFSLNPFLGGNYTQDSIFYLPQNGKMTFTGNYLNSAVVYYSGEELFNSIFVGNMMDNVAFHPRNSDAPPITEDKERFRKWAENLAAKNCVMEPYAQPQMGSLSNPNEFISLPVTIKTCGDYNEASVRFSIASACANLAERFRDNPRP